LIYKRALLKNRAFFIEVNARKRQLEYINIGKSLNLEIETSFFYFRPKKSITIYTHNCNITVNIPVCLACKLKQ